MEKYLEIFLRYEEELKSISKADQNIASGVKLSSVGISFEDEKMLLSYLKTRSNIFDGSDGSDDGSLSLSLVTILDLNFSDKLELINFLTRARKETDNAKIIEKLTDLINAIEEKIEEILDNKDNQMESFTPSIAQDSLTYPFIGDDISMLEQKLYELRQYAFNKAKDKSYFPTKEVSLDTSKFDSLSLDELQSLYNKENFFKLSRKDVMALLQATANRYLMENGVEPCRVEFVPMAMSKNRTQFGEYSPNSGCISLNSKLLDLIDEARAQNNPIIAYRLLTTCIHEARHRVQFANLDKDSLTYYERAVADSLKYPQNSMSYVDYLSSLDEIDARNASYEYLKEMATRTNNSELSAYYNLLKRKEMQNKKNEIDPSLKKVFGSIYDGNFLVSDFPISKYQNKINNMYANYDTYSHVGEPGSSN